MSTRFYFRRTILNVFGGTSVIATSSNWEDFGNNNGLLLADPASSNFGPVATLGDSGTTGGAAGYDIGFGQFISKPLGAGSTAGMTFSMVVPIGEVELADDMMMQAIIRVVSNDGTVVRGTAYSGQTATAVVTNDVNAAYELPLVSAGLKTRFFDSIALSTVAIQAGDRLVVEVGARATSISTAISGSMAVHDTEGAPDFALSADRPQNASYPFLRPWIEFSGDLFPTLTREQYRFGYEGVILNTDAALPFVDVTKVDGLDSAPVSAAQHIREGIHGGYVTSAFQQQRVVTLEGDIYANPSALESYLETLKANFAPTRSPRPLFFGIDSGTRMVYGKSQGLRYAKDSARRLGRVPFQVQIICNDPRIYLAYAPKEPGQGVTTSTPVLVGTRETYPTFTIRGPITNPSIIVTGDWGSYTLTYTGVIATSEVLVIDSANRTATLNYNTNVRKNLTVTAWPVLVPGKHTVALNGSATSGTTKMWMKYQEAYE